jgi:integrase
VTKKETKKEIEVRALADIHKDQIEALVAARVAEALASSGVVNKGQADKPPVRMKARSVKVAKAEARSVKVIATQDQADKAPVGAHKVAGLDGLYLNVGETGAGSYMWRYRFAGRRREMGLGSRDRVTLAKAKDAAKDADDLRRKNIDPVDQRRRVKAEIAAQARSSKPLVFEEMVDGYLSEHAEGWKHRYSRAVWFNPIKNYGLPILRGLKLEEIEIAHILAVMKRAEDAGAPELAKRVRQRIEQVLNRAIALSGKAMRNPADIKLIGAVRPMKRKGERPHYRAVEVDLAPKVYQELRALAESDSVFAAWCLMALTAVRPSEALKARWSEIDLSNKRLWILPATRMKGGKEHIVPLSGEALAVLERQQDRRVGDGDAVFPSRGGSPLGYTCFAGAPAEAEIDAATPHGWRSVFRRWAGDIADDVPRDLAEAALAHSLGSVEGAYWRGSRAVERRRKVMESYAAWLTDDTRKVLAFPTSRKA